MKRLFNIILFCLSGELLISAADNLAEPAPAALTPKTIAIMDLAVKNETYQSLAEIITNFIFDAVYHLGKEEYKVVARNLRDELLKEIEFSESEQSDNDAYLLRIGKHLCVQYLLTGSISSWDGKTYLSLQMIDVVTSELAGSLVRELNREKINNTEIYTAVQTVLAIQAPGNRQQVLSSKSDTSESLKTTTAEPGRLELASAVQTVQGAQTVQGKTDRQEPQDKQIAMVRLAGGVFLMGSEQGKVNEEPVHEVELSDFYMSRYEVTESLYRLFCRSTNRDYYSPAKTSQDNLPVRYVSWYDACAFCNWLSLQAGLTPCYTIKGKNISCDFELTGYRLPTEAEWEYAATGGRCTRSLPVQDTAQALPAASLTDYAGSAQAEDVAWYKNNAKNTVQPVGSKRPNALGLYDLSGNVWEWCWDCYAADYYDRSLRLAPAGPREGNYRVLRGGGWNSPLQFLRTTARGFSAPDDKYLYIGFRIVRKAFIPGK